MKARFVEDNGKKEHATTNAALEYACRRKCRTPCFGLSLSLVMLSIFAVRVVVLVLFLLQNLDTDQTSFCARLHACLYAHCVCGEIFGLDSNSHSHTKNK